MDYWNVPIKATHTLFESIVGKENLFSAWQEFKRGKEKKQDVRAFAFRAEDHLFDLHRDLVTGTYRHSSYQSFYVRDPKLRPIHKPAVRDRVLHHAIVKRIEPIFEPHFIFDAFSSRKDKGTHKAVKWFVHYSWRLSKNNTKTVWTLHCDIRKFFHSVDHAVLIELLSKRITDQKVIALLEHIIGSFRMKTGIGMPLGNLTSQLFSNVYLTPLDRFVTETLGVRTYVRYADDFLLVDKSKERLESCVEPINNFLRDTLHLVLHPNKITLRKWHQGVDFLGYVSFPHHTVLRPNTKRRIFRRLRVRQGQYLAGEISKDTFNQSIQSYLGILTHCHGRAIEKEIKKRFL